MLSFCSYHFLSPFPFLKDGENPEKDVTRIVGEVSHGRKQFVWMAKTFHIAMLSVKERLYYSYHYYYKFFNRLKKSLKKPDCYNKCECCKCNDKPRDPVCGENGKTYRNSCEARCKNAVRIRLSTNLPWSSSDTFSIFRTLNATNHANVAVTMMTTLKSAIRMARNTKTLALLNAAEL